MRQWPSLIGNRYGALTVVEQAESSAAGHRRWVCRCDCGNSCIVLGSNLKRGTTVSCGCKKQRDLTGMHIGKLTVLERSDRYGSRGSRKQRLWKCRCDCGTITYKATDTLTNGSVSMCRECAGSDNAEKARAQAGFRGGTQISKITNISDTADNTSGVRGVYLDKKTGLYRARIKFQGKLYNLGTFSCLEDAVKARRLGEEKYFGAFLEELSKP